MVLSEKVVVVWVSVVTVKEVVLMGPAEVSVSENVVVSVAVFVVCTVASILEVWGEVLVSVSAAETIDVVSVVTEPAFRRSRECDVSSLLSHSMSDRHLRPWILSPGIRQLRLRCLLVFLLLTQLL